MNNSCYVTAQISIQNFQSKPSRAWKKIIQQLSGRFFPHLMTMDRLAKENQKRLIHFKAHYGLADLKSCSLIVPNKATLNLSVKVLRYSGWLHAFMFGFMFVLSTAQSPDAVLPDSPPVRVIVSLTFELQGSWTLGTCHANIAVLPLGPKPVFLQHAWLRLAIQLRLVSAF